MDNLLKLLEEESRRIVAGTESHFCDGQIGIGKQPTVHTGSLKEALKYGRNRVNSKETKETIED